MKNVVNTFLDLLRSGKEFDCDLIIGDTEMPATFVWDGESPLTTYGAEFYGALMESPYEILPNGNIEIFCDDYKLGEHFALAAAGHIGISEYNKLFGQPDAEPKTAWVVTDDDCRQCCREISEKVFEFIQICSIGDKYAVAQRVVKLDDYSAEQWEEHIELYSHDGFCGFISDYDNTFPMRIIAEYIFETYSLHHLLDETYDSVEAAAKYIAGVVDCEIDY